MVSDQLSVVRKKPEEYFFRASAEDFKKIPGSPIAYWVSSRFCDTFLANEKIGHAAKKGLSCSGTDLFYRYFWEISINQSSLQNGSVWFPITKGGPFRKWFGNNEYLINWSNNGNDVKKRTDKNGKPLAVIRNENFFFKQGVSWNDVSSGKLSGRYTTLGSIPTDSGPVIYLDNGLKKVLAFLNSCVSIPFTDILCPTIHFGVGQIAEFPLICPRSEKDTERINTLINISKIDWNCFEVSWDFTILPLLHSSHYIPTLKSTYEILRINWQETTFEMQRLEEENNRIFIEAYGLQDELTPEVPLKEITLTCNPHYRYKLSGQWLEASAQEQEAELERRLRQDTIKEFLSYAVGCMFGRYSLDAPGLILANQGDSLEDYFRIVQEKRKRPEVVSVQSSVISKDSTGAVTENCQLTTDNLSFTENCTLKTDSFLPDIDNVIPILDQDWFIDDITSRFSEFLKTTFGTEHYEENLKFITTAIGKDIRKYFLKDFYKDHLKTYKKRPIYWLFASPKGSFNALIYMHRYRPDTVSVILNDYLREFRTKLQNAQENLEQLSISADATKTEKTKALKQIENSKKQSSNWIHMKTKPSTHSPPKTSKLTSMMA